MPGTLQIAQSKGLTWLVYLFGYLFLMEVVQVYLLFAFLIGKQKCRHIVLRAMPGLNIMIKRWKTDERGNGNYNKPFWLCPWPLSHKCNSSDLLYEIISSWEWWLKIKREKLNILPRNQNDIFIYLLFIFKNEFLLLRTTEDPPGFSWRMCWYVTISAGAVFKLELQGMSCVAVIAMETIVVEWIERF